MRGGENVGYKVKRGSTPTGSTIKDMLTAFVRRMIVVIIVLAVMVTIGYVCFQIAYERFPVFADAADDLLSMIKGFYVKHGLWTTLGVISFICIGVWAIGEETNRKERRKDAMNEMMK